MLAGRAAEVRPCVACNEDCRAFDPVLLCSVNPDLGPPGRGPRPAAPLVVRDARPRDRRGRVAIVGAGPAGLECATRARRGARRSSLFDERADDRRRSCAVAAARAEPRRLERAAATSTPPRSMRGDVELRLGDPARPDDLDGVRRRRDRRSAASEVLPDLPGIERALAVVRRDRRGAGALAAAAQPLVVDDGFGWWPCASAVELGVSAGCAAITVRDARPGVRRDAAARGPRAAPRPAARRAARGPPLTALDAVDDRRRGAAQRALRARPRSSPPTRSSSSASASRATGARSCRAGRRVRVIGDALVPRRSRTRSPRGARRREAIAGRRPAARPVVEATA